MPRLHIGISGWQYAGWRGDFYPVEIPQRRHLEYATRLLGAVEVNGTFYSLKSPASYEKWYRTAAEGSVLAIKGSRYISHRLRLEAVDTALANFFANGLLRLEDKLGPILWQFPPRMKWNAEAFAAFCSRLPDDFRAAAKLGAGHDERVAGKLSLAVDHNRPLRHAFEIRDARMLCEEALAILQRHGHALVFADTAGKHPYAEDLTADFVYVRLHGAEELYASGYSDDALRSWARRIQRWRAGGERREGPRVRSTPGAAVAGRDVYVFFDNDAKTHAPFDALTLHHLMGQPRDLATCLGDMPVPPRIAGDAQRAAAS